MALRFIGKDPDSPNNGSPTVWVDEDDGSIVIQGWKITSILRAIAARRELPDDTDEAAAVRADRLRMLREGDHRFLLVIEESVLRNVIGGPEVMAGQLGHLITVASLPSVSLGIIPMGTARDVIWPVEDFWVFDTAQVNVELVSGWLTLTQPREVAMYGKAFNDLSELAVRGAQARALITAAIDALSNSSASSCKFIYHAPDSGSLFLRVAEAAQGGRVLKAVPGRWQVPEDRWSAASGSRSLIRKSTSSTGSEQPVTTDSLVTLSALVPGFASEYPAYFFRTQQTWDGVSLVAVRRGGASEPGLYAVITADSDEMREALAQEG